MAKHAVDIEQWDRYWAYGNIHSFSQVSEGNYQGALAEYWQRHFRGLAAGSRVLDIATGNGAIALLALEESDRLDRGFEVVGVDLADIDPAARVGDDNVIARLKRIRFHGRTPAERLPFEDGSMDIACSQFGLEYSDLSRAVPEVARVLAPRGQLALVMHHRDSLLLAATREELRQLDFVLNEVKLYLRARNLLRAMADSGPGRGAAKVGKKRRALQEAMERIREAARKLPNPQMLLGPARYVHEIFSATDRAPPAELLKWLEEALARVVANQRRLQDMTAAARGENDMAAMASLLREHGLGDIAGDLFHREDGGLLGWRVEARKP